MKKIFLIPIINLLIIIFNTGFLVSSDAPVEEKKKKEDVVRPELEEKSNQVIIKNNSKDRKIVVSVKTDDQIVKVEVMSGSSIIMDKSKHDIELIMKVPTGFGRGGYHQRTYLIKADGSFGAKSRGLQTIFSNIFGHTLTLNEKHDWEMS